MIPAMGKTEGMAQFMDGSLFQAGPKQVRVRRLIIEFGTETVQGDHRARPVDLGKAEYKLENGYEEIHIGDTNGFDRVLRASLNKPL